MPTYNGPGVVVSAEAEKSIASRRRDSHNTLTDTAPDAPRMRLIDWKPLTAGLLRGRAAVELNDLVISVIRIFERDGARWSQMPSESMRGHDGQILKDDRGKTRYRSLLKWKSREL